MATTRYPSPPPAAAAPAAAKAPVYRDAAGNPVQQSAIAASLAANPNASKGGYEGPPITGPDVVDPYDYNADPILNKIKAATVTARQNAQTAKLAALRAEAIRFGEDDTTGDAATAAEAEGNPYSVLADLRRGYEQTSHDHGEQLNQANLWYSGAHAKQLADDATAFQGQQYDARLAHNDRVGQVASALAAALSGADSTDMAAEGDAAKRATDRAAAYGYDPGAQNAVANTGPAQPPPAATTPPPAAAPPASVFGTPQSTTFGGTAGPYISTYTAPPKPPAPKAKALANPYVTGTKRG